MVPFLPTNPPLGNRFWNWYDAPSAWEEFIIGSAPRRTRTL